MLPHPTMCSDLTALGPNSSLQHVPSLVLPFNSWKGAKRVDWKLESCSIAT